MGKTEELTEKLGKLRRNEEQMSPEQRRQYAKNLQAFRRQICADASAVLNDWCFGGLRVIKTDQGGIDSIIRRSRMICEKEKRDGEFKRLGRILLTTYSVDEFLDAGVRIHNRIWYEAYAPYWISRCVWNEERKTWWNPIIKMWWVPRWREWVSQEGDRWTVMLPPTEDLVRKQYQEDKANYEKWAQRRGLPRPDRGGGQERSKGCKEKKAWR